MSVMCVIHNIPSCCLGVITWWGLDANTLNLGYLWGNKLGRCWGRLQAQHVLHVSYYMFPFINVLPMAKFGEPSANFGEKLRIYTYCWWWWWTQISQIQLTSQKIESEQQVVIYFVGFPTLSNNKTMKGSVVIRTTIYTTLNINQNLAQLHSWSCCFGLF